MNSKLSVKIKKKTLYQSLVRDKVTEVLPSPILHLVIIWG